MTIKANLEDLDNLDLITQSPVNGDVLTYDSTRAKWVPKKSVFKTNTIVGQSNSYIIELDKWGIKNDGTNPLATTQGINEAIVWAKASGYNHIILPSGTYSLRINSTSFSCIIMQSGIHFEMADGCNLQLENNSSPWYRIFEIKNVKNVKISGGKIIGDKKGHIYELGVKFVRGGVNADGSLNNNPNFIRSEVLDRNEQPGILKVFRLWKIPNVVTSVYSFYQYKDTISNSTLVGVRTNGQFAPASPTGRGWFAEIEKCNKMIFVIDITSSPLSDEQISKISAKVDSQNYTHEWGQGIEILGSHQIEVENIEISDCTGDAISTSWLQYKLNPSEYTQEDMGSHIYIYNCNIHHCRRQGITLGASNDTYIYKNQIHHIGKNDDGVTSDFRSGIAPMFGIDIESMVGETNIPYKFPYYKQDGLEVNFRLFIFNNYIHDNERGHFVNTDGNYVTLENNIFEGYNIGSVSSDQKTRGIKYLNNSFINCSLIVKGNHLVDGADFNNGQCRMIDVEGAIVRNIQVKEGAFLVSSVYGYFGTPSVNVTTSTFTYSQPHEMGNTAKVCFEQWVGRVPAGIDVNKIYYVVNRTDTSFQVSEAIGGAPVVITDAGEIGFNISRYNYGRCYVENVLVEREWRPNTAVDVGCTLLMTGGVAKNITVKNYDIDIKPPYNYVGRPITLNDLTVIEGATNIECCNINNGNFIKAKAKRLGGDITFGSNDVKYMRKINANDCFFESVDVNLEGNVVLANSTFVKSGIGKAASGLNSSMLLNSYLENSKINLYWLVKKNHMTIAKCTFNNVTISARDGVRMIDNLDVSNN
ncbi:right-handed parallel beta-helix repeat-containing protein [Bacillus cereus]|uniref:right-handed parallel beta-helix repeat-containing protein n=1 Tax=Bacillus cereus group TaxID=86661 RepID=UPI0001A003AD|nr:right-handed parallel beta-helix repeat-containing protein [Bacillus cereus]EEK77899.1 YclG (Pectin lyase-like protein) [Bacillus cereus R309803]HDR4562249.1 right-handed parallel beta-helix repeat-containing protein [Bacillus luti]